jgi:hypothetical protein
VQHQFTGWNRAGGEGDQAGGGAAEEGVVHQGGEALRQAVGVAAGMTAGQIEQVGDERAHPLGLLLDQLQGGGWGPLRSRPSAWPAIRVIGVRRSWLRTERDSTRSQQGQAPDEGIGPIVASGAPRCPGPHELQPERHRSN